MPRRPSGLSDRSGIGRAEPDRRGHPDRARRGVGRDGRRVGRDAGDRPGPGLPDGPPGAADRARGPRGARPEPSRRQPGPCRSRVVGHRRAGAGAAPRRPARAGRDRLPRRRRPLAVVRPGHRRAQGPRGRSDRRGPRGEGARGGRRRSRPSPTMRELAALRDWLAAFLVFVRLFDRAVGLVPQLEPRELERSLQLLGRIPDTTILRLFDLLGGLPDDDVIGLVERCRACRRPPRDVRRSSCRGSSGPSPGSIRAHDRDRAPIDRTSRATASRRSLDGHAPVVVGARAARGAIVYWLATAGCRWRAASDPDLGRLGRRPLVRRGWPDALAAQPAREPAAGDPGRDRRRGRHRRGDGDRAGRPGRAAGRARSWPATRSTRPPRLRGERRPLGRGRPVGAPPVKAFAWSVFPTT